MTCQRPLRRTWQCQVAEGIGEAEEQEIGRWGERVRKDK